MVIIFSAFDVAQIKLEVVLLFRRYVLSRVGAVVGKLTFKHIVVRVEWVVYV